MTREKIIGAIIAVVILGVTVYALYGEFKPGAKYEGLTLTVERDMDEATRTMLAQRLATAEAAIVAAEQSGQKPDIAFYLSIASDAYMAGDLVKSREALETYFETNTIDYTGWNTYGTVLEAMGDYDKAREAYGKAISLGGGVEEFYRDYIELLKGHYPEERDEVRVMLEADIAELGQSSWNMVELSKWYEAGGDCTSAKEHMTVAATLAPSANKEEFKKELDRIERECR